MSSHQARVNSPGDQEIAAATATPVRLRRRRLRGKPEQVADFVWGANYTYRYHEKAEQARARRANGKVAEARRRQEALAQGIRPAPVDEEFLRRSRRVAERKRYRAVHGYEWGCRTDPETGRTVPAFVFHGFVSDEGPLLKAFVARVPRWRRLRVGGHKGELYRPDAKVLGLDEEYVVVNTTICSVIRADLDHDVSAADVRRHCRRHGFPEPNIMVGDRLPGGVFRRPHLIWILHRGVPLLEAEEFRRVRGLYRRVSRGLVKAFLELGSDPAGMLNQHRMKNPVSPRWDREILAEQPYNLCDIAPRLDMRISAAELDALHQQLGGRAAPAPDHDDPRVSAGSNGAFRDLAEWARNRVAADKASGMSETAFERLVAEEALRIVAAYAGHPRDIRSIEEPARKLTELVAPWTWNVYRPRRASRPKLEGADLKAALQEGGRKACERRAGESLRLIGWAVATIAARGEKPLQRTVLDLVRAHGVTSARTVGRHWHAALGAVAAGFPFPAPAGLEPEPPQVLPPPPPFLRRRVEPEPAPTKDEPRPKLPPPPFLRRPAAPRPAPEQEPAMPEPIAAPAPGPIQDPAPQPRPAFARRPGMPPVPACLRRASDPAPAQAPRKRKASIPMKEDPAPVAAAAPPPPPAPVPEPAPEPVPSSMPASPAPVRRLPPIPARLPPPPPGRRLPAAGAR